MKPNRKSKKTDSVFTMVELLIVISIMIILMALLLPALRKAKECANGITCSSNLKNLGTAEMSYMNDNNEWFTPTYPGKDENNSSKYYWTNLLYPYLGGMGTSTNEFRANVDPGHSVYFCPSHKPNEISAKGGQSNDYPSYGLNVSLGGRDKTISQAAKLAMVKKTSSVIMFSDVQYDPGRPSLGYRVLTSYYFSARHPKTETGNSNVIWIDSHISFLNTQWAKANANTILDYYNFLYNW